MQDWHKVQGSQDTRPEEFDLTTSETIAYQRRNIERVEVEDMDGSKHEVWQYEEREISHDDAVRLQLSKDAVKIVEIDTTSTTGLLAVTDLYEELINKGVL